MTGATGDVGDAHGARFRAAESVRTCDLEGELVLLDLARGEYFGLGEIGTRAWSGLANGRTAADVAMDLAPHYDVELAILTRDLARFATELAAAGLLVAEST